MSLTVTGDDALSEMRTQIRRLKDIIDAINVGEKSREATKVVRDVTHDFAETVEESVRTRPLTALAIAIGAGVLVGMALLAPLKAEKPQPRRGSARGYRRRSSPAPQSSSAS
jgi:ElaB/YqjD/DUF883 family membrane-anchored ribosome-binding protein